MDDHYAPGSRPPEGDALTAAVVAIMARICRDELNWRLPGRPDSAAPGNRMTFPDRETAGRDRRGGARLRTLLSSPKTKKGDPPEGRPFSSTRIRLL